jgi:predicted CoA-binding protein
MSKPVAVILGASADRSKFGNKSVRAHLRAGYDVIPVNPKTGVIEGIATASSLSDVDAEDISRVSVYLPPSIGITLLAQIAALNPDEVWLNPGTADAALIAEAKSIGLNAIEGCSIVELGLSPREFP